MLLFAATASALFFLLAIAYAMQNPTYWRIASFPASLVGLNSSIDQWIGAVGLINDEQWTLFGAVDIVIAFYFLRAFLSGKRIKLAKPAITLACITVLTGLVFLSWQANFNNRYQAIFAFNYLKIFIYYIAFYGVMKIAANSKAENPSGDEKYFWFVVLASFLSTIFYFVFTSGERLSLPHLNVNILPNFLLISTIGLFAYVDAFKQGLNRRLFWYAYCLSLVMLTESRTGLSLMTLYIVVREHYRINKWIRAFLIPASLITLILSLSTQARFADILIAIQTGDWGFIDTLRSRFAIWDANMHLLWEDWAFGIGPGMIYQSYEYLIKLGSNLGYSEMLTSSHNDFIQMSMHFGVFFSLVFSTFLLYSMARFGWLMLLSLVAIMLVNSNLETARFSSLIGFLIAISFQLQGGLKRNPAFWRKDSYNRP